ncbi:uncharacterized protein LOC108914397 [Anoplophora glabripennis]|uniref:uncharacterized protein LOC108914397 n=1 Tax=Anoplophora glabripennis TaxID=217634 RepID=UPI00087538E0|nr:uncharacterized protein LOC108914397 [Anoplophora glabripennis]
MERIFKIKTKSNIDPRDQYPSERRYSASIVIGLSVVFLQLFLYSVLMGTLIVHKLTMQEKESEMIGETTGNTDTPMTNNGQESNLDNSTEEMVLTTENPVQRLFEKVEKDINVHNGHYYINIPALVCSGCFVMALGFICSFVTGILAWKRWYIDHNITFFFLASSFSTLTSAICLLLSGLITVNMNFNFNEYESNPTSPVTFSLAMNIIILSSIGLIWSFLSTKVSYRGMKNGYPDDVAVSKGGRTVQVSTVTKGSKNCTTFPPDIINHFPAGEKLAKYVPKKDNSNLPKAESNFEYQQRVDKFLSGTPESPEQVKV